MHLESAQKRKQDNKLKVLRTIKSDTFFLKQYKEKILIAKTKYKNGDKRMEFLRLDNIMLQNLWHNKKRENYSNLDFSKRNKDLKNLKY